MYQVVHKLVMITLNAPDTSSYFFSSRKTYMTEKSQYYASLQDDVKVSYNLV